MTYRIFPFCILREFMKEYNAPANNIGNDLSFSI